MSGLDREDCLERMRQIAELSARGWKITRIARELGIRHETVSRYNARLREGRIPVGSGRNPPRPPRFSDPVFVEQVAFRYRAGAPIQRIATDLSAGPATVRRAMYAHGIPARPPGRPARLKTEADRG